MDVRFFIFLRKGEIMRYQALVCDYDGTIATNGTVEPECIAALERLLDSGRKLILVTGRQLDDLLHVFPHLEIFDRVVAENGALLYRPAARSEKLIGEPPSLEFIQALQERGVFPSTGRIIVATGEPHQTTVLEVIHDLGLELQVIFNKGAVMVLPSGVNKATGLRYALSELGLSHHNVVGVGDAENDQAFLAVCECAVAVANALPLLKKRVDWITQGERGAGVIELIDKMVTDDLRECRNGQRRRQHSSEL